MNGSEATHNESQPQRKPWTLLILLCLAQFMVVLDVTVVNLALPSIGEALSFSASDLSWVVTTYVLFAGGLILLGGRAADLFGRRQIFLAGLVVFTSASLLSGLAASSTMLIAARALQGVGAAMLTPAALSIVVTTYTGGQHTKALAAWAAVASGGAAAGMLLGGMLTSWLSWEWIFLINVPIGIFVAICAARMVPASKGSTASRSLDLPGALSAVGGLGVLIYALQRTAEYGWGSPRTLVLLAISALMLLAFIRIERGAKWPLVPSSTWRQRPLTVGAAVMFGATGILVGSFFVNSIYLQEAIGDSPLRTGIEFLPIAASIAVAAHLASHALQHLGSRGVAVLGLLVVAGGTGWLAMVPDGATYAVDILPGYLLLGLGTGLVFPAASVTAMSEVTPETAGLSSGLMTTAHEVGAAVGVAVFSAIAVATTTGAGTVPEIVNGYGNASAASALVALALAAVAWFALPAIRPAADARVGIH